MPFSMPWPKKGNKVFAPAKGGKSFHLKSIFWHYPQHAAAFKLAAEMIIDKHQDATGGGHNDELLLPVCYLYRHSLELKLKDLIQLGVVLGFFNRKVLPDIWKEHSLAKLWTKVKSFLDHQFPNEDRSPLLATEAVVHEFHRADPSGQKFRYERDGKGKQFEHALPEFIGLGPLRMTMEGVFNFLEGCEGMLRDALSNWEGP